MSHQVLAEATLLAQTGKINECIERLQNEIAITGNSFTLLSNLSALYLQLGQYRQAIDYSKKAISMDPYSYIPYFNRFLCNFVLGDLTNAWKDLQKALSCLYLLRGYEDSNLKFMSKSIQYCEQNARTYLARAKINEGKNNKLVENDYSTAIEYDPNLAQIYQQRALYFRKFNRVKEFQEDLVTYHSIKSIQVRSIQQLQDNQDQKLDNSLNLKQKIEEKLQEFKQLFKQSQKLKKELNQSAENQQGISKLPLNSLQSNIDKKDCEELLLSDRADECQSTKTLQIKKEEINFKKRADQFKIDKKFKDIFQDQSSKELNQKIWQLEKDIQMNGGKISLQKEQDQLDVSDPSNFLTAQIEKAIKQIQKLGVKENLHQVTSVKSANSRGSIGSNQPKELTLEQFSKYDNAVIQIISLQEIENYNHKETAKMELKYNQRTYQTSMAKYEWLTDFTIPLNQNITQVQVKGIQKGGIFRDNFQIGEGTINLLETSIGKCILANKQRKTAILYFKLSLI